MPRKSSVPPLAAAVRMKPLFSESDIPSLVKVTKLSRLDASASPAAIVEILLEGFDYASDNAVFKNDFLSYPKYLSEIRDINNSAAALLQSLGLNGPAYDIMRQPSGPSKIRARGVETLQSMLLHFEATGLNGDPVVKDAFTPKISNVMHQTSGGEKDSRPGQLISEALDLLPKLLGLIVQMTARAQESEHKDGSSGGRPPALALDELFACIAGSYREAFGEPPQLGPDRANIEEPSLRWAKAILHLAGKRVGEKWRQRDGRPLNPDHPALAMLGTANSLKPTTLADRMVKGWKAWECREETPGVKMVRFFEAKHS